MATLTDDQLISIEIAGPFVVALKENEEFRRWEIGDINSEDPYAGDWDIGSPIFYTDSKGAYTFKERDPETGLYLDSEEQGWTDTLVGIEKKSPPQLFPGVRWEYEKYMHAVGCQYG